MGAHEAIAWMLPSLGWALLAAVVLWGAGTALRDASIVDPCWGAGFAVLAWQASARIDAPGPRAALLVALTTIWGLRLAGFLLWRNWGEGEDRRYAAMRSRHGRRFWIVSLGTVFGLQAALLWFISWPVQAGQLGRGDWTPWDAAGTALWAVGFLCEALGDWQLARFRADPRNAGRVLDRGLWRYTRHPNYFGDFCVWWGLYLIAVGGGAWFTAASPLLMSVLLLRVSGVTLLEKTIAARRPEYRAYAERTNAFFPGRPRPRREDS